MRLLFYTIVGILVTLILGMLIISNHVRSENDIALKNMLQERMKLRGNIEFVETAQIVVKPYRKKDNVDVHNFMKPQICKAVIATIMGRPPSIMHVYEDNLSEILLSYTINGVRWKYQCNFGARRVDWRRIGGSSVYTDIYVKEVDRMLIVTQTHSDGSKTKRHFAESNLM